MSELDLQTVRRARATFRETIARRNMRETFGAGIVLALFGRTALTAEELVVQVFSGLAALGAVFVAWYIYSRGQAPVAESAGTRAEVVAEWRGELQYQAELLERVPAWYLGPLVPGVAGLLIVGALNRAWGPAWAAGLVLTAAAGITALVWWMNRRAASALREQAAKIREEGAASG